MRTTKADLERMAQILANGNLTFERELRAEIKAAERASRTDVLEAIFIGAIQGLIVDSGRRRRGKNCLAVNGL